MRNLLHIEEKNLRIKKRLKTVEELYSLAFEVKGCKSKFKPFKTKLNLDVNERVLINTARELKSKVGDLKELGEISKGYNILAESLTQVHNLLVDIIKDEFKGLRNRNDSISIILN